MHLTEIPDSALNLISDDNHLRVRHILYIFTNTLRKMCARSTVCVVIKQWQHCCVNGLLTQTISRELNIHFTTTFPSHKILFQFSFSPEPFAYMKVLLVFIDRCLPLWFYNLTTCRDKLITQRTYWVFFLTSGISREIGGKMCPAN